MTGGDSVRPGCSHKRDPEQIGSPTVEGPATADDGAGPTAHPTNDNRESRSMPSIPTTPDNTPRRQALRDAWLAEMWPVVPEYRLGDRPRPYRTAR